MTILDGMILVAAVACAFGLHRAVVDVVHRHWNITFEAVSLVQDLGQRVLEVEYPLLVALTPAVLVMRLRRRRSRLRTQLRQPGMAACCAAIIPIIQSLFHLRHFAHFLSTVDDVVIPSHGGSGMAVIFPRIGELFGSAGVSVGVWVLGAWLILALSGRRRPEKSGIDRLGRIVGIGWISITAITAILYLAEPWQW